MTQVCRGKWSGYGRGSWEEARTKQEDDDEEEDNELWGALEAVWEFIFLQARTYLRHALVGSLSHLSPAAVRFACLLAVRAAEAGSKKEVLQSALLRSSTSSPYTPQTTQWGKGVRLEPLC